MTLLFVFLMGVLTGLRSLTPPAVTAWGAHWCWLKLPRLLSWVGTTPAVAIFTVLAVAELCADKLPKTPPPCACGILRAHHHGRFCGNVPRHRGWPGRHSWRIVGNRGRGRGNA